MAVLLLGVPKSVTTAVVSPTRYTFVRSDNGAEIETFRPRQIAESLKFDLSSVLHFFLT